LQINLVQRHKGHLMLIDIIAGARPNFMKVAALFAVADQYPTLNLRLIHTGQHYDANMSGIFLEEFGLPTPVCSLGVGSGSHAVQTAEIMVRYEQWVKVQHPGLVIVVGDVNSTVACAMVAAKEGVAVAHVEAGLRSFDRTMPEEINRVLTDSISDLLFVTEPSGIANLAREGHPLAAIHLVGHVMIDTLLRMKSKAALLSTAAQFGLQPNAYAYLTLHRPSNVDNDQQLALLCDQITWLAEQLPVIFPVHPRTQSRLEATGLKARLEAQPRVHLAEPFGYLDSLSVMMHARLVATDSGGIQEESSALGIPCLTLRDTTERPITISEGTNTLIGQDWGLFRRRVTHIVAHETFGPTTPIPYWDGKAAIRIMNVIANSGI
jgi:UDP-N-acetylglucosamine 2-epimerase (non-hydrolysing)